MKDICKQISDDVGYLPDGLDSLKSIVNVHRTPVNCNKMTVRYHKMPVTYHRTIVNRYQTAASSYQIFQNWAIKTKLFE